MHVLCYNYTHGLVSNEQFVYSEVGGRGRGGVSRDIGTSLACAAGPCLPHLQMAMGGQVPLHVYGEDQDPCADKEVAQQAEGVLDM